VQVPSGGISTGLSSCQLQQLWFYPTLGAGLCLRADRQMKEWSCPQGDWVMVSCRERWGGLLPVPFGGWTPVFTTAVPAPARRGTPPPRRAAVQTSLWSVGVWCGGGREQLVWGRGGIYTTLRDGGGKNVVRARVREGDDRGCGWGRWFGWCQQ